MIVFIVFDDIQITFRCHCTMRRSQNIVAALINLKKRELINSQQARWINLIWNRDNSIVSTQCYSLSCIVFAFSFCLTKKNGKVKKCRWQKSGPWLSVRVKVIFTCKRCLTPDELNKDMAEPQSDVEFNRADEEFGGPVASRMIREK